MNLTPMTVLMAGDTTSRSATLRKWLRRRGCRCQFVASFREACRLMSQTEFDLVLCQYELSDRTAFPLLDWLDGSRSTLLFSARAGKCTRWLPVIERGKRCLDRALLLTTDLPNALEKMLDGSAGIDAMETAVPAKELEKVGTR